jgi:hypothetical protein
VTPIALIGGAAVVLVALVGPGGAVSRASCVPGLTIRSPVSGETVRAPLEVSYRVRCFRLGPAPYGHIHAWAGEPGESRRYELHPRRQAGVVQIRDATLSGERTLTFQLARADHKPVPNRAARAVVRNVVFEGP